MRFAQYTAATALCIAASFAAPIAERQAAITDADILQYALTVCLDLNLSPLSLMHM